MKVLLQKQNGIVYDISKLVSNKKWSGEKSKAQRTFSFTFYKTTDLDIECFDGVSLYSNNNVELFQGQVYKNGKTLENARSIQAYDIMYRLVRNKDSFTFDNQTADSIFRQVCDKFQVPVNMSVWTEYHIPQFLSKNRDLYSTIIDALSTTYKQTGKRYYIRAYQGKLNLIERSQSVHQWVLETGVNLISASYSESAEAYVNQVRLTCKDKDKKDVSVISKDDSLIAKFGLFDYQASVSDTLNQAQLQTRAWTTLQEKAVIAKTLSVEAMGLDDVISGDAIYLSIPQFNIAKSYYVDKDTHSFKDRTHTMQLNLVETLEI